MPPKGHRLTPEHRARISAGLQGHPVSPEARAKISQALTGLHPSSASLAKRSATEQGRIFSDEHRAKISAAKRGIPGRPLTPETRAKISAANKGRIKSDSEREHLSAALKGRIIAIIGECVYCFGPANAHDHVIPRGRPGWDDPDNVVLACASCNGSKGQRTPDEWMAAQTSHLTTP